MRDVYVAGIGQTSVGEHWERSLRDLAVDAISAATKDAQMQRVDALYVGNMLSGELVSQGHLGALIADWAGLGHVEALRVEAADASGSAAVRLGFLAVASGLADVVAVCGVEKVTDAGTDEAIAGWSSALDAEYESAHGVSMSAVGGLVMRRYMLEYGVEREHFAPFVVNAHKNGANNPFAMYRSAISADAYARAGMVASPVSLLDGAPLADGAAAVILCSNDHLPAAGKKPVRVRASVVATDRVALHSRREPLFLQAAYEAARKAYACAGVGPKDIQALELHDSFTVMAALCLEACGFAERGKGTHLAQAGAIALQGSIPISTMGGLKARGHPIGATGVYQIVELATQLRGEAGANQVDCHIGMALNLGGSGGTAVAHILEAR